MGVGAMADCAGAAGPSGRIGAGRGTDADLLAVKMRAAVLCRRMVLRAVDCDDIIVI